MRSSRTTGIRVVEIVQAGIKPATLMVVLIFLMATSYGSGVSADCRDYGDFLQKLNSSPFPGLYYGADSSDPVFIGENFYLVEENTGLVVGRLSPENEVEILSITPTWDQPQDVVVQDGKAYVADALAGLMVYDISDPQQPAWLAHIDTPGRANHVLVAGDRAFILDTYLGFTVIDVAEVRAPRIIASIPIPNYSLGEMARHGDTVVVVAGYPEMHRIDISDPDAPSLLPRIEFPQPIHDLDIQDDLLAVVTWDETLEFHGIEDLQSPDEPLTFKGSVELPFLASLVRFAGPMALVSCAQYGVVGVDSTDPTQAEVAFRYTSTGSPFSGMAMKNDSILLVGNTIDVLGFHGPGTGDEWGIPQFATAEAPGTHFDFTLHGDYAYVIHHTDGLMTVVNLSDPSSPEPVNTVPLTGSQFTDVVASGDRLFVSRYGQGIFVYSIEDPAQPVFLTMVETMSWVHELVVHGDLLVSLHNFGFSLHRLSGSGIPWPLYSSTDSDAEGAAFKENLMYLATGESPGLEIWDVTDPSQPIRVAVSSLVESTTSVAIHGDHLFVTNNEYRNGLHILDISNPLDPVLLPEIPQTAADVPLQLHEGTAYMLDGNHLVHVLDVSNPAEPIELGFLPTGPLCEDIAIWNGFILTLERNDSFGLFPLHCGALSAVPDPESESPARLDPHLVSAWPNPFNPRTTVGFHLARSERVDLAVFDLSGGLIRTLVSGEIMNRGPQQVTWDGRDDRGKDVASGVYLAKLKAGAQRATGRMVLIR